MLLLTGRGASTTLGLMIDVGGGALNDVGEMSELKMGDGAKIVFLTAAAFPRLILVFSRIHKPDMAFSRRLMSSPQLR